ncbi:rhombosortase [Brumicola pallidula]|jgi:rhomboid family GlyGly-CTERM serine protease|uniref:Membrane protein, Rhomboid family n=1 Tax=Brumicola pallidula DSM 14239 = ACAM 615 TaxID=1121922 RepID=K6ZFK9_9ALTE|nr:rhombosortase [Glaciecola pallidula]GAC27708.1 membrane protein, Rhomboid family [Glaciecola pallidula DSM 14239 = ACAM 615]
MIQFPTRPNQYLGPLIIGLISVVAFLFEPMSSDYFALERSWWAQENYYQVVTGHFLHTNFIHILFNLLGLLLLWALHGDDYKAVSYLGKFLLISVALSLCLYFFSEGITWYVGLSGAIHGVFAWGCIRDLENKLFSGWLLLIGLALKVGNEQLNGAGSLMPDLIDANVAVDSHLYGAIIGLLIGIFSLLRRHLLIHKTAV